MVATVEFNRPERVGNLIFITGEFTSSDTLQIDVSDFVNEIIDVMVIHGNNPRVGSDTTDNYLFATDSGSSDDAASAYKLSADFITKVDGTVVDFFSTKQTLADGTLTFNSTVFAAASEGRFCIIGRK